MLTILAQTRQAVVCLKPVGLSAQGAAPQALPQLLSAQLGCEIFPVHRLDQAVGGVMIYAKSAKEAASLSAAMGRGEVKKTYLAVLDGVPAQKAGTLEDLLYHDRVKNKTYVVRRKRAGVKTARLRYTLLSEHDGLSLVRVELETGRTHQIRVQFASRGLPLLGDGKYGSRENRCTCALWSCCLRLPVDGAPRTFFAPPPQSFPWTAFGEVPRCADEMDEIQL